MLAESSAHSVASNREILRYLDPAESYDDLPRSASDPCLTAFAQLAALRLGAQRAFICLVSKEIHHIIAESGQSLSLQQSDDPIDRLWYGVGRISPHRNLVVRLSKLLYGSNVHDGPIIVKDTYNDDRYELGTADEASDQHENVRFLACVPLFPPQAQIPIGCLLIVDPASRESISTAQTEFLTDMGTTIMNYLEIERARRAHTRSERMVKALGLFLAEKDSLREWWLETGHSSQPSGVTEGIRRGRTMENMADVEFGSSELKVAGLGTGPRPVSPTAADCTSEANSDHDQSSVHATSGVDSDGAVSGRQYKPINDTHEVALSRDTKAMFARAGKLIREALSVDGVMLVDPGSKSSNDRPKKAHFPPEASPSDRSSDVSSTASESESSGHQVPLDFQDELLQNSERREKLSRILSLSQFQDANVPRELRQTVSPKIPQKAMKKLFKRYPSGHVFNFNTSGTLSSDTDSVGTGSKATADPASLQEEHTPKLSFRENIALAISAALPGARSVAWVPLWDQRKEDWLLGALIWTYSPNRVLWSEEELTYITTFGHSITAELSRLAALSTTKVQRDFISSVSHELRSPLHGVLASVEFLQDTQMSDIQTDMVNNIHDSSKVLLDTINHVLSFSKMEDQQNQNSRSGLLNPPRQPSRRLSSSSHELTDVCQLMEEVLNTVYAGRSLRTVSQSASDAKIPSFTSITSSVSIIVSVDYFSDYRLPIDAGAWRRILMNLFSNSLKYTDHGYVRVSLKLVPAPLSRRRGSSAHILVLKVKDSGIGMSEDFLQHHLSKPFSQENDLTVGTGLGLSIVSGIIRNLKGRIGFNSSKGSGTEVTVRLPFHTASLRSDTLGVITEAYNSAKKLRVMMEGFDQLETGVIEDPTTPSGLEAKSTRLLENSIRTTFKDWFGMDLSDTSASDLSQVDLLILRQSADREQDKERIDSYREIRRAASSLSLVLVLCRGFSFRETIDEGSFKIVYLCQPFGPYKLAKALRSAFTPGSAAETGPDHGLPSQFERKAVPEKGALVHLPSNSTFPADSQKGHGSPVEVERDQTQESQPGITDRPRAIKALLVDDNNINLKVLAAYMRRQNIEYATASDGLQAFNEYTAASNDYDIIFMDIMMPIMTGAESTQAIRRFEKQNRIQPVPIVALTGGTSSQAQQDALAAGIDKFVTKPVVLNSLIPYLDHVKEHGRSNFSQVPSR